jgi:5-methyltetrahydrofolate--homocysteine methyltransferase
MTSLYRYLDPKPPEITMTNPIDALIAEKGVLLADGATGTNLFAMGLESGEAPELWNEAHPDRIRALHQGFVDAGADIILTNSFGGTRHRLKLHDAQDRVFDLNRIAAELAREIADTAGRKVIVAGSVGPTGELLEPLGSLTYAQAVDAFAEQIEGLKAGGAEVAWIETMSSPDEIRAAAEAAIRIGLPYTFTASFDTAGRTMMGLAPKDIHGVTDVIAEQPVAIGANCGVGASDILSSLLDMAEARPGAKLIVKGNCGIPEFRGTEIHYSGTPDLMADYARLAIDSGATIIGGCCGTSFEHLKAMRVAIDAHARAATPELAEIVGRIGPLRNKTADQSGAVEGRRERRRTRA